MKKHNDRAESEYRIVTDGTQLYRLNQLYKIPKGVIELFEYEGRNIYTSNGKLKLKFSTLQRIQPRNNSKHLSICIRAAIEENKNVS